jgi:hypothetical protein
MLNSAQVTCSLGHWVVEALPRRNTSKPPFETLPSGTSLEPCFRFVSAVVSGLAPLVETEWIQASTLLESTKLENSHFLPDKPYPCYPLALLTIT